MQGSTNQGTQNNQYPSFKEGQNQNNEQWPPYHPGFEEQYKNLPAP